MLSYVFNPEPHAVIHYRRSAGVAPHLAVATILAVLVMGGTSSGSWQTFTFGGPDFTGDGTGHLAARTSGGTLIDDAVVVRISDEAQGLVIGKEVRVSVTFRSGLQAGVGKLSRLWLNLWDDSMAYMLEINDSDDFFEQGDSFRRHRFRDSINADTGGAGLFDLAVGFSNRRSHAFDPGETAMFDVFLNGPGTLTPASFLARSQGAERPDKALFAAIYLDRTGPSRGGGHYVGTPQRREAESAKALVPEPGSCGIWMLSGLAIGFYNCWRRPTLAGRLPKRSKGQNGK